MPNGDEVIETSGFFQKVGMFKKKFTTSFLISSLVKIGCAFKISQAFNISHVCKARQTFALTQGVVLIKISHVAKLSKTSQFVLSF